jgi:hypothetical protein
MYRNPGNSETTCRDKPDGSARHSSLSRSLEGKGSVKGEKTREPSGAAALAFQERASVTAVTTLDENQP